MSEAFEPVPAHEQARELAHESAAIQRDSQTRKTYGALAGALKIMGMGSMTKLFEQGGKDMEIDTLHPQERAAVNHIASEVIGIFKEFRKGIQEKMAPIAAELGATGEDAVTVAERLYKRPEVEMNPELVTEEMIRQEFEAIKA